MDASLAVSEKHRKTTVDDSNSSDGLEDYDMKKSLDKPSPSSFLVPRASSRITCMLRHSPRNKICSRPVWIALLLLASGLCERTMAASSSAPSANSDNSWWSSGNDDNDSTMSDGGDYWSNPPPRNPLADAGDDGDAAAGSYQEANMDARASSNSNMFPTRRPMNAPPPNQPFQRPPPPPPPGNSNLAPRSNRPPPSKETASTTKNNDYIPIDYSFPSKDLAKSAKKTKRSLFGWGNKNTDDEEGDSLPKTETTNSQNDAEQEGDNVNADSDWFDIPGNRPSKGNQGDDGDGEKEDDRPWVDEDIRRSGPRRPDGRSSDSRRRPAVDFASARRDPVARYMANSIRHRFTVYFWASAAGAALGGYLGKALLGNPVACASFLATIFGLLSAWARNPYGEWARAVGLGCWWTLMRSRQVRRQYPTQRHVRALLGMGPRVRFPPNTDNPWSYKASDYDSDESGRPPVEFEMWSALLCMVLVGSMAGGAVPIIPSWMGALGGAASLAILTTRKDSRGDLCRSAGMRVRRTMNVAWNVMMEDVEMPKHTAIVTRKILDKILILDKQHKLQDKLMGASSWVFNQVQNVVKQAKGERIEEEDDDYDDDRRRDPRDRDRRRDDRGRGPPPRRRGPPPDDDRRPPRRPMRRDDDDMNDRDDDRRPPRTPIRRDDDDMMDDRDNDRRPPRRPLGRNDSDDRDGFRHGNNRSKRG